MTTPTEVDRRYESLVRDRPADAIAQLDAVLVQLDDADDGAAARVRVMRNAALAARALRDLALSDRLIRRSLDEATALGDREAEILATLTIAYNHLLAGRQGEALALIESIDVGDDPLNATRVRFQHGSILLRIGRGTEALDELTAAKAAAREIDDDYLTSQILKNRAVLLIRRGRCEEATLDLRQALSLCRAMDLAFEAAFCELDIALAASTAGDLPTAFAYFERAEQQIRDLTGSDFEAKHSHCRALLAGGMFREAAWLARSAADSCEQAGFLVDGAENRLLEARACMDAGDWESARVGATKAADAFEAQGRPGWAAAAELTLRSVEHLAGGVVDPDDVSALAEALDDAGLADDRLRAKVLEADVRATAGDHDGCHSILRSIDGELRDARIDVALTAATARVVELEGRGRRVAALETAAAAYDRLAEQQAHFGSADLRVGVRAHAARLGRLAIGLVRHQGDPESVLAWVERLNLAMVRPVAALPPDDPELGVLLAQLRALDSEQELGGHDHSAHEIESEPGNERNRTRHELEERIRTIRRSDGGRGHLPAIHPPSTPELVRALDGRAACVYFRNDGMLLRCTVVDGRAELAELGPFDRVERMATSVATDLRRRALRPASARPERIERTLAGLDDLLSPQELGTDATEAAVGGAQESGRPLLIVPPAELWAIPWSVLPSFRHHPVVVTPSLTGWADGNRRRPWRGARHRLAVAGPDLALAVDEVTRIAEFAPGTTVLTGPQADVGSVLDALGHCDVAHIAAHGRIRTDNPLFSSLRLADGDLNVYALEGVDQPPDLVILSACHVGMTATDSGQELLGMVSGLLGIGVSTVVASTLPVPDSSLTASVMAALHESLDDHVPPAVAMSILAGDARFDPLDLAAFATFGRG